MISKLKDNPEFAKHFASRLIIAAKKIEEKDKAKVNLIKQVEKVKSVSLQSPKKEDVERELETLKKRLDILLEKEGVILDKQAREAEFSEELKKKVDELEKKIQSADRIIDSLTLIKRKIEEYAQIKEEEGLAEKELIKKGGKIEGKLLEKEIELEEDIEKNIREKEIEKIERVLKRLVNKYNRLKKLEKFPKSGLAKIEKRIMTLKEAISIAKQKTKPKKKHKKRSPQKKSHKKRR